MAETTTRFGLPLIQVGQGQKEVTHNEAIIGIDAIMHLSVQSRTLSAPPETPVVGAKWIVAPSPSGPWAGKSEAIAEWTGAAWRFLAPGDGLLCWIVDEGLLAVFGNGAWNADFLPVGGLRIGGADIFGAPRVEIAEPSGGSVIDDAARTTISILLNYLRTQGIIGNN